MKILKKYEIELAKTLSGHWYSIHVINEKGKKRFIGYRPSSTTILNAYPQSQVLTRWIAEQGWHESQRIFSEAGERGTRVHNATQVLEEGDILTEQDFSLEEWWKLSTFVSWHKEYNPKLIVAEMPIFASKSQTPGRLDRIYEIAGDYYVVDIKTSKNIYKHFALQFSPYAQGVEEMTDIKISATAALHLGAKNKNGYRFVLYPEWKDHLKVFMAVKKTWQYDNVKQGEKTVKAPVLNHLPKELKL